MTYEMLTALSTALVVLMASGFAMYHAGFRKGLKEGEVLHKRDIFIDGVKYVLLDELEEYAEKLMDEGYSGDYPMTVFSAEEYFE